MVRPMKGRYVSCMASRTDLVAPDVHYALLEAVSAAGSQARLAVVCGCTTPNIWQLVQRGRPLPAEYVLRVEAATGVSRHRLRPDIYPADEAA